ncbi:transposase [Agarilytica rhodophyticola]|uniref:transposase n=1 Tax=Agarilytica rhodophyticola TaxID=1737490 RepID=UPI000B34501D|nr:transposase [Agarilytica rhodophyticola]
MRRRLIRKSPHHTAQFKLDAVSFVLDQDYSTKRAAESLDIRPDTLREWIRHVKRERTGQTPAQGNAPTSDPQRIQELEAKTKRIEREKDILKKATTLLMSEFWSDRDANFVSSSMEDTAIYQSF